MSSLSKYLGQIKAQAGGDSEGGYGRISIPAGLSSLTVGGYYGADGAHLSDYELAIKKRLAKNALIELMMQGDPKTGKPYSFGLGVSKSF